VDSVLRGFGLDLNSNVKCNYLTYYIYANDLETFQGISVKGSEIEHRKVKH
jgi:hypothetical protein